LSGRIPRLVSARDFSTFSGSSGVDSRIEFCYPHNPSCELRNFAGPEILTNPLKTDNHVQVLVRDNNVDQALRALKKKMQREGIFREMKLRGHYEKPSEKKAREKAEAVRRARKLVRKKLQREGLLPAPVKPKRP
jgi:small subunit ribosomal protein S21